MKDTIYNYSVFRIHISIIYTVTCTGHVTSLHHHYARWNPGHGHGGHGVFWWRVSNVTNLKNFILAVTQQQLSFERNKFAHLKATSLMDFVYAWFKDRRWLLCQWNIVHSYLFTWSNKLQLKTVWKLNNWLLVGCLIGSN